MTKINNLIIIININILLKSRKQYFEVATALLLRCSGLEHGVCYFFSTFRKKKNTLLSYSNFYVNSRTYKPRDKGGIFLRNVEKQLLNLTAYSSLKTSLCNRRTRSQLIKPFSAESCQLW
jgi:hypothetical protein